MKSSPRSPRMSPGSGARRTDTHPGMRRTRKLSVARASPKPAETSPMPVEKCTTPADKNSTKKLLQEHSRSFRALGARPAGPLTRPHGKALATGREERPISRLQHLREPGRHTHRCSGASVGDNHEGPQKRQGESCLKPAKRPPLERGPPRSRAHAHPAAHQSGPTKRPPWSEVRLVRGLTLPRADFASLEGPHHPRAGFASLEGPRLPRVGSASLEAPSRAHLLPHAGTSI
jgi:hypothetical protein